MTDHYRTISARSEGRRKIERSDFLAIAFPIATENAFFAELAAIEKKHFDATHHCWGFRLSNSVVAAAWAAGGAPATTAARSRSRTSDAGEPSGTAGKPILGAIESADLFDAAVVVVRWYGGVKLGTGGLARAYRDAASDALASASVVDRYVYTRVVVEVPFDMMSVAYRLVDPPHVILAGESFAEHNEFAFDVRAGRAEEFRRALAERRLTLR
jgi:putative IMPACT (imprinted ancient) family translation regulator